MMENDVLVINENRMQGVIKNCKRGLNGELEMECVFGKSVPVVRFAHGVFRAMIVEDWSVVGMGGQTVGELRQIPLMIGRALTFHKAQVMTLDRVETDVGRAFDYGKVYVAMWRARNMLALRRTTYAAGRVMTHERVEGFYKQIVK